MDFLRGLDAFPKLKAEDTVRTTHGACASLCALFFMAYLFASEFSFYRKVDVVDRLIVNSTHGEHLRVAFDVTFPHIPCDLLSLDALDTAGQPQVGVEHRVSKQQLRAEVPGGPRLVVKRDKIITLGTVRDEAHFEKHAAEKAEEHESVMKTGGGEGKEPGDPKAIVGLEGKCGNCYGAGALGECCNSCEAVRIAYAKKGWIFNPEGVSQCSVERAASGFQAAQDQSTGCQLHGDVDLTTVNGNFHFAPHASAAHGPGLGGLLTITELLAQTFASFNVTHEVTSLSFGDHYPGIMNPLDGQRRTVQDGHGMYQYYIKVVPTVYKYLDGRQVT